jgi:diguanylate cyclase (GGDEF)-like protein/PAS domain S-box-containing protein
MPQARHRDISKLVDRNTRASVALVVVLLIAWISTVAGVLGVQAEIAKRHAIMLDVRDVARQGQIMRMAVSEPTPENDAASLHGLELATKRAQASVDAIAASADSPKERVLAKALGSAFAAHRTETGTRERSAAPPLREAHGNPDFGSDDRLDLLSKASDDLTELEDAELGVLQRNENLVLVVSALLLLVLSAWSLGTFRRSRAATASLLASLEDSFIEIDHRRAELQAFTDAAPMAVFHADAHGVFRWLNAKASAWVDGRSGDDAVLFIRDGIVADDRERVFNAWTRLVAHGERFEHDFRFLKPDGDAAWIRASASAVVVAGRITGFVAVAQDVTASKRLQEELAQSRMRMRRMADGVPALMARLDETETYRFVNGTYRTWFGDGAPRIGTTLRQFLGEETYALFSPVLARVRKGEAVRFEMRHLSLHGRHFVGDVSYTPDRDDEGRVCGMYVLVNDISERKELEKGLFAAKELAQVTLESITDAVLTTDRSGAVTFLNRRAEALLDRTAIRARGLPIDTVVALHDPDGQRSQTSLIRAIYEERVVDTLQPRHLVLDNGEKVDVEVVAAPIRDRDGEVVGGVLVLRDVSIARAVADRMRQLAESDALTGLPNRLVFEQRLRALLAGLAPEESLAVLYMDLDGFKSVNDEHGHGAGDELLREFASRLAALAGPADTICRLGGDEFVALLVPPVSLREAVVRAESFVGAAVRPFAWQGQRLSVTLSVGVAQAPHHGTDAHTLVRKADDALYDAKQAGKNQVRVAS